MKIKLATSHKLIFDKIVNCTHSHSSFSKYVLNIMIDKCSYECVFYSCRTCGRTYNRWIKECPLYCYLWVHICFNSISYTYNIILEFGSESNNCMTSIVTMYVM